ncbi:MAG: fibronectin type III domain-containing protein, partial [Planctomycetota bacterium]
MVKLTKMGMVSRIAVFSIIIVFTYISCSSAPASVTDLKLTATAVSSSQINLKWTGNLNHPTLIKIERKTSDTGSYIQVSTVGPNENLYSDTGLKEDTTYCYRISVQNPGGFDHQYSNETSVTTSPIWSLKQPVHKPSPRWGHAMAYDSVRGKVVLFGGGDLSDEDTYEWDGTDWTKISSLHKPKGRCGHAMAYDSTREKIVLFGGMNCEKPDVLNDTWEWDGADWALKSPSNQPAPRWGHGMAYDPRHHKTVLFGGEVKEGESDETWLWDGTNWELKSPANKPPDDKLSGKCSNCIAYDSKRGNIVLFRGYGWYTETWEWDGTNWAPVLPPNPSSRCSLGTTYDIARDKLFVSMGDETWEWNGTNWSAKSYTNAPYAR